MLSKKQFISDMLYSSLFLLSGVSNHNPWKVHNKYALFTIHNQFFHNPASKYSFDHKNYSPKRALAVSGCLPDMPGTFRLPEMFLLRSREFSTTEVELNPMASAERIGSTE